LDRVRQVVAEGADLVDIGGVKAAPDTEVTVAEEIDRTASLVAAIRSEFPDLATTVLFGLPGVRVQRVDLDE
jgi:dihydropteroate synthase